jgi:transposase InsO family protein
MDFITGLPEVIYKSQFVDAILVVVDRFTKMARFFPVSTRINAAELAELIHTEIELKYGPPNGIVSDRGSVFTSKFWGKLCYISHTKLRLSTAFHAQTDGQTERMNQVLEQYLRRFIDEEQVLWPKLLATAEYACNNAPNTTTDISPFECLMGYSPDFYIRSEDESPLEGVPAALNRVKKLQQLREKLAKNWQHAVESQAKYYNSKHKPMEFKYKDLVLLSTKNLKLKLPSRKLAPKFIGPFRVLQKVGTQAYRLALPQQYSRIHNVFHVSLLEPWIPKRGENDADSMPMPDLEDEDEWEVEEIKAEKSLRETTYFLLKWKDWPSEYNQWVPEEDMENAKDIINKFRKAQRKGKTTRQH